MYPLHPAEDGKMLLYSAGTNWNNSITAQSRKEESRRRHITMTFSIRRTQPRACYRHSITITLLAQKQNIPELTVRLFLYYVQSHFGKLPPDPRRHKEGGARNLSQKESLRQLAHHSTMNDDRVEPHVRMATNKAT
jgi:hypothetical protein